MQIAVPRSFSAVTLYFVFGALIHLSTPAQGDFAAITEGVDLSIQKQVSIWGNAYFIEREGERLMTRNIVEYMLRSRFWIQTEVWSTSEGRHVMLIDDLILSELIQNKILDSEGRVTDAYQNSSLPNNLSTEAIDTASSIRESQKNNNFTLIMIRYSELVAYLKDIGVLDHNGHFLKGVDSQIQEDGLASKDFEIRRYVNSFREYVPNLYSQMPKTRGYVVRRFLAEMLRNSVQEDRTQISQRMRVTMTLLGQIWEILGENPSLSDLAKDANLTDIDGWELHNLIFNTVLSNPQIREKIQDLAGNRRSSFASPLQYQKNIRWNILQQIPDSVFVFLADSIQAKLRSFDFSGHAAIVRIMDIGAVGNSTQLSQLLQQALLPYFKNMDFGDKSKVALSYLELDPRANAEMQLAAVLQGTGPFVQKLFQLIGDEVEDPVLQKAASMMKASVQPFPSSVSRMIIEQDLGRPIDEIFVQFADKPVSAGTIGQIHFARTRATGEDVAVKVLRPGIREHFIRELNLIKSSVADSELLALIDAYAKTIFREMDLRVEADNIDHATFMLRPKDNIYISERVNGFTATENVLIMRRAEGRPLSSYALFQKVPPAGALELQTPDEVRVLLQSFSQMVKIWFGNAVFGNGYFHGDFHTGNALAKFLPDERVGKTTVIDFGNFPYLTVAQRREFLVLTLYCHIGNLEKTVESVRRLVNMSQTQSEHLTQNLKSINWSIAQRKKRMQLALASATAIGIRIPPEFMNFARSKLMLESAIRIVNKNLDFLDRDKKIYSRLNSTTLFGTGAALELTNSLFHPNHGGRGDNWLLTPSFVHTTTQELTRATSVSICSRLFSPKAHLQPHI